MGTDIQNKVFFKMMCSLTIIFCVMNKLYVSYSLTEFSIDRSCPLSLPSLCTTLIEPFPFFSCFMLFLRLLCTTRESLGENPW